MSGTAALSLPSVRGVTNRPLPSRELRVAFKEVTDLSPADYASQTLDGHDSHQFVVGAIKEDETVDREKWLYVFAADVRDSDLTVLGTSLKIEGQYDHAGALRLVDWSGGPGSHAGLDRRPVSDAPVPEGIVPLTIPGRRAQGGAPAEGVRTVLLAFLSHVPLPAHRLDRYFSNDPDTRLPARALLVDPTATAREGAFSSTMSTGRASPSSTRWARPAAGGTHTEAYLIDPVDFAFTLHEHYQAAANLFDAFTIENATRMFHADLTRSVASGYMAQHDFERKGKSEDDVPGKVFAAIEEYQKVVQAEHDKMEFWAHHLYEYWMGGAAFELAREDASDYGPLSSLSEERRLMIDAEVARQGELLQGAERSDRGKQYLGSRLALAEAKAWYERVAFASQVTARIADVPKVYFEYLQGKAAEETKVVADGAEALHKRKLAAAADYLSALEYSRGVAPSASGRIDERQLRLLDPMLSAVGTGTAPSGIIEDAASEAFQRALAVREGRGVDALDQLGRALRSGSGIEALPVWTLLAPGGGAISPLTASSAGLVLTDHGAVASGSSLSVGPEPIVTFGPPRTEGGLIVLAGGDGSEALADLRPVLGGGTAGTSGPAASADPRRSALSRLLDVTGRPLNESPGAKLQQIREALADRQGELDAAQLREQLQTKHINWAGRLFIALNFVDLVTGIADTQAKLDDAERDLGRGQSRWNAYVGAVGAGAGAASAFAGLIESAEAIIPARLLTTAGGTAATGLGTFLKVAGGVGSVLAIGAGLASFYQESRSHDGWGQASAATAVVAGLVGVAAAFSLIPLAGWAIALVILGLAALSALFAWFSDTPVEEWLKNSIWSEHEAVEVEGLAPDAPRVSHEVEDLLALLAAPRASVELRSVPSGGVSRLMRYRVGVAGAPVATAPDRVRLTMWPGLQPPGSRLEITAFKFLHPFTFWNAVEDAIPFSEGERTETPARVGGTSPQPLLDLVLVSDERGPAFIREYPAGVLPAALRRSDGTPPGGTDYSCRATVHLSPGLGTVANPAFDLQGSVGFMYDYGDSGAGEPIYKVVESVSTSESVDRP